MHTTFGDIYGYFPVGLTDDEKWEVTYLMLWVWGCVVTGQSTIGPYMAWARGDIRLPGLLGMN